MSNVPKGHGGTNRTASGVVAVAAVMLLIAGVLNLFRGIMAIANDPVYVHTPNYVFKLSLTGWGWIHLILAVIAVLVGIGLFRLETWARVMGVIIASLLILANFLSIPYYPFWSLTVMAACGIVVWGLCVVQSDATG